MGSTCVVGLQWGDEAKGKIVDLLCDQHDVVVRYQGGANAGHTVVVGGVTYKLSLVPTGILRQGIDCVIGNGVVIHPPALLKEIETLSAQGGRFRRPAAYQRPGPRDSPVSPGRGAADRGIGCRPPTTWARPAGGSGRATATRSAGSTASGSPTSTIPDRFASDWPGSSITRTACSGAMLPDFEPFDARPSPTSTWNTPSGFGPFVRDTTTWLHEALNGGRRLLFEGAQGSLLDVDHGSYPYVTSSNSSAAGIAAGSGVPTRHIDRWIGVVKAYTTRVGGGPFPTEQDNAIGERIRRVGKEYGTVTGRPRRCGWFDAVAVRHSARVSGSTEIAVMLLDVLSGLDELKVAVPTSATANGSTAAGSLADFEQLPAGLRDASRLDRGPHRDPALV